MEIGNRSMSMVRSTIISHSQVMMSSFLSGSPLKVSVGNKITKLPPCSSSSSSQLTRPCSLHAGHFPLTQLLLIKDLTAAPKIIFLGILILVPFIKAMHFELSSKLSYSKLFYAGCRSEMSLCVGTHLIPHPNKIERGGEDAFFVSSYGGGAIAVADGVSGWAELNVDPALFSRELMANASSLVEDTEVNYDPQMLLKKAHASTTSKGSATVIVAMMESNGILRIANVGDCGLRVIRNGQIMFSTSPQEHYFDCPYQLSSEVNTQTYLDAVVSSVKLMEGDIVVMGSDGLFDNVFDQEIVSTVTSNSNVNEAAKALARLARDHSMDSGFDSPYSSEARTKGVDVPDWKKLLGMKLTGGKLDDITVVVGEVTKLKEIPVSSVET